nr:PAS domain-containing protein [uncultured Pseudomonas sp.]
MPHRILIITGNARHAETLRTTLARSQDDGFISEWRRNLHDALVRLGSAGQDAVAAVLVELNLIDSQGLDTFDRLFALAPGIPLMILDQDEDERQTWQAIQLGAQGRLSQEYFGSYLVAQTLHMLIQRRSAEDALFIEKSRNTLTLALIADAVIDTDVNGRVIGLNDAAHALTGWSANEAHGQPIENVMRLVNGETREPVANPVVGALREGIHKRLGGEIQLIRRNGSEVAIANSAAPFRDAKGRLQGAVLVCHGT